MKVLETTRDGLTVYHAEVFDLLRAQPDGSVNLIFSDGPYYRVKTDEAWDTCFRDVPAFLEWTGRLLDEYRRVLAPNGSLYHCCAPSLAGRIEAVMWDRLAVVNHIVWAKPGASHAAIYGEERFRGYVEMSERILFAEHHGADHEIDGFAGYGLQCHSLHKQVYAPLGGYFQGERERAGLTRNDVEVALGFVSSADPTRGTALCCRWEEGSSLPTEAVYYRYRALLGDGFLVRDYTDLRRDHERLRREYEAKREAYEALRRPFYATEERPYTDVWDFPTVQAHPGKHPCQKPLEMLRHIVETSSRPGDLVLDAFCGSGVTGEAALALGRRVVLSDGDEHWARTAAARCDRAFGKLPPVRRKANGKARAAAGSLFGEALL